MCWWIEWCVYDYDEDDDKCVRMMMMDAKKKEREEEEEELLLLRDKAKELEAANAALDVRLAKAREDEGRLVRERVELERVVGALRALRRCAGALVKKKNNKK